MADIDVPFNYDPVNNDETDFDYTVPPSTYAIVSVTMSVNVRPYISSGTFASGTFFGTTPSDSTSFELRLKAGSVFTFSEFSASNNTGVLGAGVVGFTGDQSVALAKVDGVVVATLRVYGIGSATDGGGGGLVVNVDGNAKVEWSAAEYNSIS